MCVFVCRSSSSSDSEDGGADVIGVGGGSDSEGEEGVKGSPSGGVKSPSTSQGEGWSPSLVSQCNSPL